MRESKLQIIGITFLLIVTTIIVLTGEFKSSLKTGLKKGRLK
ncbi:MAG: hypothetical protein ACTSXG_03435 [Alphaproteobacteria bacterium]